MWLGIICIVTVLVFKILFDYTRRTKFPPGPQSWPIVGNLFAIKNLVKETKSYANTWCRLAEKYGSVVGLKLGLNEPLIIVSGKAAVTEMLNRSEFDGRPDGFVFRYRCGGTRQGILFTDTDVWHSQRRFTFRTLKEFGFGKATMESILQQDAITLTNIIIDLTKDGKEANIHEFISRAVLSNIWFLIEGTKFDVGTESSKLKEVLYIFKDVLKNSNTSGGVLNQFPFLRHLFPELTGFTMFKLRQERLYEFFMGEILRHKASGTEGEGASFIDVYLEEIKEQKANPAVSSFNENQLVYVIKDLVAAGVDTTDNTISFVIAFLVVHQDVQMKVHDEIDKNIGKDTCPSLRDKNRLPYLMAVLAEVSRLANVGPTSIPHRAIVDSTLLGFEIKRNYTLLANLKSVHMDKEHWGDPEIFRPERFINENGQFVDDSWLMPFGLGRRKCPGESLAKNTVFLFIASLFQKLRFILPENHPEVCLQGVEGFVVAPPEINVIAIQTH